ncbi:homeobox protein mab-5-like [Hydractinia symbiolongicarpus]|uniref:homeobox protein mab-5-like n=1 Tax=Hydractinia symbiolongicarpus TaxID=13093 RepID=UPI00254EEF77|nr:homeobox protein mab-5-like [Hydractinia symbiolongicarpus]
MFLFDTNFYIREVSLALLSSLTLYPETSMDRNFSSKIFEACPMLHEELNVFDRRNTVNPNSMRIVYPWMVKHRKGKSKVNSLNINKEKIKTRTRKVFEQSTQLQLEMEFRSSSYLTSWKRQDLSEKLNLSERQVRVWF